MRTKALQLLIKKICIYSSSSLNIIMIWLPLFLLLAAWQKHANWTVAIEISANKCMDIYIYILCTLHVFEPYTIMDILLLAIIMTICCLCLLLFFLCYCFYTTVKLRHARPTWNTHIVFFHLLFHLKFLCVFIRIAPVLSPSPSRSLSLRLISILKRSMQVRAHSQYNVRTWAGETRQFTSIYYDCTGK